MAQTLSDEDVLSVMENTVKLLRQIGTVSLARIAGGALVLVLPRTVTVCPRCHHLRMVDDVKASGDCTYCETNGDDHADTDPTSTGQ